MVKDVLPRGAVLEGHGVLFACHDMLVVVNLEVSTRERGWENETTVTKIRIRNREIAMSFMFQVPQVGTSVWPASFYLGRRRSDLVHTAVELIGEAHVEHAMLSTFAFGICRHVQGKWSKHDLPRQDLNLHHLYFPHLNFS